MKVLLLSVAALLLPAVRAVGENTNTTTAIYKNPAASIDDRVADLLARMTLEDSIHPLLSFFNIYRVTILMSNFMVPQKRPN